MLGCNHCHTPVKKNADGSIAPDMSRMLSGHPQSFGDASGSGGAGWTLVNNCGRHQHSLGRPVGRDFRDTLLTGRHLGHGRHRLCRLTPINTSRVRISRRSSCSCSRFRQSRTEFRSRCRPPSIRADQPQDCGAVGSRSSAVLGVARESVIDTGLLIVPTDFRGSPTAMSRGQFSPTTRYASRWNSCDRPGL